MKIRNITIGFILIMTCFSCNKDNHNNDFCINCIFDSPSVQLISEQDFNTVRSLFESNNLNYGNYLFYKFQADNSGYHHARCYQFINNLKVFIHELIFHFDQNNNYKSLSGHLIEAINLDTISSMDQRIVIEKYLNELKNDEFYSGNMEAISKNCFDIEFGYYDLNAWISHSEMNFTKAWKVKPKDKEYPVAYINDVTSTTIYYDNGIRY